MFSVPKAATPRDQELIEWQDKWFRLLYQEMTKMTPEVQALVQAVANETTVDQSILTLVQTMATQIAAVADNPAAVKAAVAQMQQNAAALSAAVTANTPAPTPPAGS